MPEAEPFTALGRGNGFPFCFPISSNLSFSYRLDVSSESNVNPLTLEQAMKCFWLGYQFKFSASSSISGSSLFDGSISASTLSFLDSQEDEIIEPFKRVCSDGQLVSFQDDEGFVSDNFSSITKHMNTLGLARLYDGDPLNESNFIGYGFPGKGSGFPKTVSDTQTFLNIIAQNARIGGFASYRLASYMTGTEETTANSKLRYGSVSINFSDGSSADFAYESRAIAPSASGSETNSVSANSSGANATWSNGTESVEASISFNEIDIYGFA